MTKEQLHQEVLARKDELIKLCCDLIKIKNQSPIDSQEPAVRFVEEYLEAADIPFERLIGDAGEEYPMVLALSLIHI